MKEALEKLEKDIVYIIGQINITEAQNSPVWCATMASIAKDLTIVGNYLKEQLPKPRTATRKNDIKG